MKPLVAVVVTFGFVAACSKDATAPRAATPTQVTFSVQPSTVIAGQVLTPAVQVTLLDAGGNLVPTATDSVTIGIATNPSLGTLAGTVGVRAVNGVASFPTLTLNKTGNGYTLAARAGTLRPATSTAFTVTPGPATQLVFSGQPTTVVAGRAFAPPVQVTAWDAEGNTATGFTGDVAMAIAANPGGGTLSGTPTVAAVAGVATFGSLAISALGNGYTLVASAGTLADTSAAFIVGTTGILYNGGPIIYTPKVAALYWSNAVIYVGGPTPRTSGSGAGDQSLIGAFLRSLGGSSYFNILTTYYDATNTSIQNVATYTQYWADTLPSAVGTAPTDADVQAEVERGFTSGAWTYDPNTMYAVFTGSGINLGGGFGTQYCAYHFFFVDGTGRNVRYAVMPYTADYPISHKVAGCSEIAILGSPNNDPAADAEVNVLAHEFAETATDPNGNAWFDQSGNEIGDLCNFNFGAVYATGSGAVANEALGGKNFLVQMLWVNALTPQGVPVGCRQGWSGSSLVAAHTGRAVLSNNAALYLTPRAPHKMLLRSMPR